MNVSDDYGEGLPYKLTNNRGYLLDEGRSRAAFRHRDDRMPVAWMDGHASNSKHEDIREIIPHPIDKDQQIAVNWAD